MTYHSLPLTYQDKIQAVKVGVCCQSIRRIQVSKKTGKINLKKVGDELDIFTWAGIPYRSKHSWDFRTKITEVLNLQRLFDKWYRLEGSAFLVGNELKPYSIGGTKYLLSCKELGSIIERDWIFPNTQEHFEEVLKTINGLKEIEGTWWQVIRWVPPSRK